MNEKESEEELNQRTLESIKERESVKERIKEIEEKMTIEMGNLISIMDEMGEETPYKGEEDEIKNESKFDKQLQESEEKFKSDSQNNWLKKDDDDDDIIDYVYESNTGIKKPDDDEKN